MTVELFVGYDERESVAYHVFCQSVIQHASTPICIHPLALKMLKADYLETHNDGSNAFIYSRFLVPYMMGFAGWAIFADGDMVCTDDIAKLYALRDPTKAVQVVQHKYTTTAKRKYIGTSMETINQDYPRKNWSSVILWNCGHSGNAVLTPEYVMSHGGRHLHRFEHLSDDLIGGLPEWWNWMPQELGANPGAALLHYTLGEPGIAHYAHGEQAQEWHDALAAVNYVQI